MKYKEYSCGQCTRFNFCYLAKKNPKTLACSKIKLRAEASNNVIVGNHINQDTGKLTVSKIYEENIPDQIEVDFGIIEGGPIPAEEKHYRPFKDFSELMKITGTKLLWVKDKECFNEFLITGNQRGAVYIVDRWYSMKELLEQYTFPDGSPCGVGE